MFIRETELYKADQSGKVWKFNKKWNAAEEDHIEIDTASLILANLNFGKPQLYPSCTGCKCMAQEEKCNTKGEQHMTQ